jgi:hypothetical protein
MTTHPQSISSGPRSSAGVTARSFVAVAPYWLVLAGIYLAYGFLWYFSAKVKLIDDSGTMPAGLAKAFDGSILASAPGLDAAWVLLGVLEAVACVLFAVSLAAGEFLPHRRKPILLSALGVSALTFAVMAFAQNVIADHESVASLMTYLAGSIVALVVVALATPERIKALGRGESDR